MRDTYFWARRRRFQYGTGFAIFWLLVCTGLYYQYFYKPPNCFDGVMNGVERGIDCGGSCALICTIDVIEPRVRWTQSFKVRDGQYNVVSYVENRNITAATPEVEYTVSLYDAAGLITERSGRTALPPDSVYPIFIGPVQTDDRIPTNSFLELGTVREWYPAETGREQFTVREQQLTGEETTPRLNAKVTNNAFTEAQNVELVATIFDASGNALTSSRTFVEYFAGQAEENVVFTWPEPIAKTIRSCSVPTDVIMAIDLSGSMNNDQDEPPEPISSVLEAAGAFVDRLRENDQVSLVTFASKASLDEVFTTDTTQVAKTISELIIDPEEETGSTNTGMAIVSASEELFSGRANDEARKVMVVLTDGLATAPDEEPEVFALTQAAAVKSGGLEIYAIGLGREVNMDFINELATDESYAYQALDRNNIDQIYRNITGSLCEDGAAVIEIIPKINPDFLEGVR